MQNSWFKKILEVKESGENKKRRYSRRVSFGAFLDVEVGQEYTFQSDVLPDCSTHISEIEGGVEYQNRGRCSHFLTPEGVESIARLIAILH